MIPVPQITLEDIGSLLSLAKTAQITVSDAIAVGQIVERVETALALAKLPRPPSVPASEAPAPAGPGAAIARAVKTAVEKP